MTKSAVLKSSALNARKALLDGAPDIDTWPALPLDSIPEEHQDGYLVFKFAVTLWVKLVPEQVILDKLKTQYDVVLRQGRIAKLVHRCLRKDPVTGGICGFLGCVPGQHLPNDRVPLEAPVEGQAQIDRTMARARELGRLFAAHPKIEATMIRLVKTRRLQKDGPQFPAPQCRRHCRVLLCAVPGRRPRRRG
ncbi:hypothetical protein [Pelomonas sp. Root1444]|uniref:hypothetical protein n=1 Tax=Pelomonas sp. Root1444 TaxID=1736464 RepID=UPI0012FB91E7|nr:hypothetical protein [Pelomonas sp. Root1444]